MKTEPRAAAAAAEEAARAGAPEAVGRGARSMRPSAASNAARTAAEVEPSRPPSARIASKAQAAAGRPAAAASVPLPALPPARKRKSPPSGKKPVEAEANAESSGSEQEQELELMPGCSKCRFSKVRRCPAPSHAIRHAAMHNDDFVHALPADARKPSVAMYCAVDALYTQCCDAACRAS